MTPLESAQARINARKPRRTADRWLIALYLALGLIGALVAGIGDETDPPVVVVQR